MQFLGMQKAGVGRRSLPRASGQGRQVSPPYATPQIPGLGHRRFASGGAAVSVGPAPRPHLQFAGQESRLLALWMAAR